MQQSAINSIPFTPLIDIGFWNTLARKKIEEYKLDDAEQHIHIKYKANNYKEKFSHLVLDIYSLQNTAPLNTTGPLEIHSKITMRNHNTHEQYNETNPITIITKMQQNLLESYGNATKPTLIDANLQMFADLKKYLFTYKLLVPQFNVDNYEVIANSLLSEAFPGELESFYKNLQQTFATKQEVLVNSPFYIVESKSLQYVEFNQYYQDEQKDNYIIVYFDAHNQDSINATFNNLLVYLITNPQFKQHLKSLKFLIIKDFIALKSEKFAFKNSRYLQLNLEQATISKDNEGNTTIFSLNHYLKEQTIDLKSFMDEKIIASDAVDLNIKLMKWRLLPTLDLELIKSTKCLLFGAGTLGCQLARNLIGWGVREITFVDYGKVSYSNPVRQSLFNFEDSTNGGRYKAEAAAEALKKIFPDIQSKGYSIEVPMPGHYVNEANIQKVLDNLALVDSLVESHDAVFLLTDSREARWLPTMLCNKYRRICIPVALGFDSFLIIRQGISVNHYDPEIHGERMACYFCNDISAPQNSTKDRTLDQQCTVTRPGLSFIAAGYASELLIGLLHHPLREGAPASDDPQSLQQTDLGMLPHFIRGQLSDFEIRLFYGRAFTNCVACSKQIVSAYEANPQQFIMEAMNKPDYLQDISGITEEMAKITMHISEIQEIDDFAVIS